MSADWACTAAGKRPPEQNMEGNYACTFAGEFVWSLDRFALVGWWVVWIQGRDLIPKNLYLSVFSLELREIIWFNQAGEFLLLIRLMGSRMKWFKFS